MPAICHSHQPEGSVATGAGKNFVPRIWRFGQVGSCLDTAANLAARGWLEPWDSVQVYSQTAGRGQLRRQWHSPVGNLYAALRLPMVPPFDGTAAAPAVGALLAGALAHDGLHVRLKWPNDLVVFGADDGADNGPRKVAGILLEERGGVLMAGIGINVCWAPPAEQMRADAALEATCLKKLHKSVAIVHYTAEALWQTLVKRMFSAYIGCHSFPEGWRSRAESLLLWRGENVELRDDDHIVRGWLAGLGTSGGLCLNINGRLEEFICGSLRLSPAQK